MCGCVCVCARARVCVRACVCACVRAWYTANVLPSNHGNRARSMTLVSAPISTTISCVNNIFLWSTTLVSALSLAVNRRRRRKGHGHRAFFYCLFLIFDFSLFNIIWSPSPAVKMSVTTAERPWAQSFCLFCIFCSILSDHRLQQWRCRWRWRKDRGQQQSLNNHRTYYSDMELLFPRFATMNTHLVIHNHQLSLAGTNKKKTKIKKL